MAQRSKMATIIQDDLSHLGHGCPCVLWSSALSSTVFSKASTTKRASWGWGRDADPNPEMNVWMSNGGTHLWHLGESKPVTEWEAQIDSLCRKQMVQLKYKERKHLYDQVQEIVAANVPYVFLPRPTFLWAPRRNSRISSPQFSIPIRCGMWSSSTFLPADGSPPRATQ